MYGVLNCINAKIGTYGDVGKRNYKTNNRNWHSAQNTMEKTDSNVEDNEKYQINSNYSTNTFPVISEVFSIPIR